MDRKKIHYLFFFLILLTSVFGEVAYERQAWAAPSVQDVDSQIEIVERRKRDLDKSIEVYRGMIKKLNSKVNTVLERLDTLQQNSRVAQEELQLLELQVKKLQKSIAGLNTETAKVQGKIDELVAELKQRIIDMYKYGATEELHLLLSAQDTFEALDSLYLLERLSRHDQMLIEQLQDKQREIELSRRTLEDHRNRLRKQMEALGNQRQKVRTTIQQTNDYLVDLRKEKAVAEKAAREMEQSQKEVGQTILTLMRQKKERGTSAGGKKRQEIDYLAGRSIGKGRGSMFDWPVRGPINSPFGTRIHPVFKTKAFHSGIDIGAPSGTPVLPGAPGEVLFQGWMRGYGQVVILDHGRDISTVYAHMSSTRVREGMVVKPGTVIGTVGNTGTTTGYHLHFEVRVGSTAKNPLDYLKR